MQLAHCKHAHFSITICIGRWKEERERNGRRKKKRQTLKPQWRKPGAAHEIKTHRIALTAPPPPPPPPSIYFFLSLSLSLSLSHTHTHTHTHTTVKEELFVGENFRTFPSKTFRMGLNFVLSEWLKEVKTRRDGRKVCKPGGRKFGMELISNFFLFYESYEIKFRTKISSFSVSISLSLSLSLSLSPLRQIATRSFIHDAFDPCLPFNQSSDRWFLLFVFSSV